MRFLFSCLIRICLTIVITLILLINIKRSEEFKDMFFDRVYDSHFNFVRVNAIYQSFFGTSFPFQQMVNTRPVFRQVLTFYDKEPHLDGVRLFVGENYLVPIIRSGLVVFIGERDGYGQVVVIEQTDGIHIMYGNLATINVRLYEHVEAGTLLGSVHNELYLVFRRDGVVLNYEDHI